MNNNIRKLLRKILILAALVLCSFPIWFLFGAYVVGNQYQEALNASIIDKVARLKSINEPKIILVADSNLAFGMNSKMLQDAINMPVVNLGLHGGIGNAFNGEIAKFNINSGDIVIGCFGGFGDDDTLDYLLAWDTVEYNTDLWQIIRRKDYPGMFITYPGYWLKSFILWAFTGGYNRDNSYSRKAFNEFGDIVFKPEKERKFEIFNANNIKVSKISDECVNRLNEYNKYVNSKGAIFLIAGYPIGEGKFTPPKEEYEKFQRELASKLDCEIISDYRDYFIPYEYFYDSVLHLDNKGANIRTQQLINDIQRWQAKRQNKTGNL